MVFFEEKELLERYNHNVILFSMKHRNNLPSPYRSYFVETVDYAKGGLGNKLSAAGKVIYSFEAKRKMERLLREANPAIAHFHIFQHQISPSVFGPLRRKGIPIILTLHDLKPICPNYKMLTHDGICERCKGKKFYKCMIHRCSKGSSLHSLVNTVEMYFHYAMGYYQGVDKYIAVSRFYRDKMIEFGFPPTQVVHIPNFIDASQFTVSETDKGYGIYFGRLSEEKGVMTLLGALSRVPHLPFFIVGSGPMEAGMKQMAAELDLRNIAFAGFKTGDELKKLIAEASFTVIPSEWYENCPMSVLESFAMGKPVIGSRIGGVPELINEGVDGLTFEPGNAEDLCAKMMELWNAPEKRKSMGKAGRVKVERDYNPEVHYEQLLAVYEAVLSRQQYNKVAYSKKARV